MSIRHQLRKRDSHDGFGSWPRLEIVAEGIDDVYRLARVLEVAQVEFSEVGGSVLRGLDRRWPGVIRALVARMGPHRGYPGRKPRAKKPGQEA